MTATVDDARDIAHNARRVTGRALPRKRWADTFLDDLMAVPPKERRAELKQLDSTGTFELLAAMQKQLGTPFGLWADDPVGFVQDVLHETTWSKQRAVLEAVERAKRVAVPSAFGTGKTHIAARATIWRALTHPPGTSLTVTTATRFRQVQRQLWPHIRSCVAKSNLPLIADQTQLKWPTGDDDVVVAYGFSAPPGDEAAVQGIHAPRLFIVIDEAGGIGRIIGEAMRGLLTGDDTHMLAIGNPPTDDEHSWFEALTQQPGVETVTISAYDAPLQTGENVVCRTCPPTVPRHPMGRHLVGQDWIDSAVKDHGLESPFVQAKVYARFTRGGASRTIPSQWIEDAVDTPEPEGDEWTRLCDLGLPGETDEWKVTAGSWVRLGVDVAADGGDEMVIARSVGDLFAIRHASAGQQNANATDVAGKILGEIKQAELLRHRLGTVPKVRVKIDAIGVGWGVFGILKQWGAEGVHDAEVVGVNVAESTGRDDEFDTWRPYRKRDEMWLAARVLLEPNGYGESPVRLRIDRRTVAQLSAPTYTTNSQGKTVVESKKSMKGRGVSSPDRAEALLLDLYEPLVPKARRPRLVV